ncbi:sialidase-3 [Microcaecilia unicolor]|uniref:exo-alpha-sialidase n=1 Tax=Microcaecilia unicolor TaxID=1415580 RepID=A0A6P7XS06_9AMPH|nr:sialidase-3 [Microcaecilia unicolor]XP_030055862.1 sialidase-3 [Microcaecilia unicolor]
MDASAVSDKTTLFRQEASGVTYRIPALLYIKEMGTFLAFAERRATCRDRDAEYLVMRRGLTQGDSVQWGSITPLSLATLPSHRTMNPCPVFEKKDQVVFLFFICVYQDTTECYQIFSGKNASKLCYISSKDYGMTWSQLTDLTQEVIGEDIANWATFAVGPGHGVQLQSGRLIVPAYTYYIHCRCFSLPLVCFTRSHSFVLYSDDLGGTWHCGKLLSKQNTGECSMAEVTCNDGTCLLYCSARTTYHRRAEALSKDLGLSFEMPYLSEQLCEPPHGCQGSVVSFIPPEKYQGKRNDREVSITQRPGLEKAQLFTPKHSLSWFLYSHPTNRRKRVDLGIYVNKSPLSPNCWDGPWIVNKGPSGYSDLTVCEDSFHFGCLFECGTVETCEEIVFQKISLDVLLKD